MEELREVEWKSVKGDANGVWSVTYNGEDRPIR